jgi:hypothetical protein
MSKVKPLTPTQRVRVAKEVLNGLASGRQFSGGSYGTIHLADPAIPRWENVTDGKCYACALGNVAFAAARCGVLRGSCFRRAHLRTNFAHVDMRTLFRDITRVFPPLMAALVEAAYEQTEHPNARRLVPGERHRDSVYFAESRRSPEFAAASRFGRRRSRRHPDALLRAIMRNIVRNGGHFRP